MMPRTVKVTEVALRQMTTYEVVSMAIDTRAKARSNEAEPRSWNLACSSLRTTAAAGVRSGAVSGCSPEGGVEVLLFNTLMSTVNHVGSWFMIVKRQCLPGNSTNRYTTREAPMALSQ